MLGLLIVIDFVSRAQILILAVPDGYSDYKAHFTKAFQYAFASAAVILPSNTIIRYLSV